MKPPVKKLKIKVCGMRVIDNILSVAQLQPDFLGLIFYPPSPRNAIGISDSLLLNLPSNIEKVAVFVNAGLDQIIKTTNKYGITTVQLHGSEPPELCLQLRKLGYRVIKSVSIPSLFHHSFFDNLIGYKNKIDYMLFDTSGKNPGGNGLKFDWKVIEKYNIEIPFLLSGGIGPFDAEIIKNINNPYLAAIDLNSKFETSPGVKDVESLSNFINEIRKHGR